MCNLSSVIFTCVILLLLLFYTQIYNSVTPVMVHKLSVPPETVWKDGEIMFYIYAISPLIGSNRYAHATVMR